MGKQPHYKLVSWITALSIVVMVSFLLPLLEFQIHHTSFSPKSVIQIINVTSSEENVTNMINEAGTVPRASCEEKKPLLRVYMYDLPSTFHFGLLGWEGSVNNPIWPNLELENGIPSYPGGLNLQHSVEYWLTLDLLLSESGNLARPSTAIRVKNSSEADVIFVPFFSSVSYNRHSKRTHKGSVNEVLQGELVKFLKQRKEWKKAGGRDHLIVAHHPNSLFYARKKLSSCMFILADFGRYPNSIANLEKDIIAPYKHMVRSVPVANSAAFDERPILAYFQGAIHRKDDGVIRQELYNLLKNEEDFHFKTGSTLTNGIREAGKGMALSKFCLNIAGDTPSSNRLFDAISTHCVPVIISDEIELPYEDVLDYSEFCVFIRFEDAVKKGYIAKLLRRIKRDKWSRMWERLKNVSGYFEYQFPSQTNDAVDMIWQTIYRKKIDKFSIRYRKKRFKGSHFL